MAPELHSIKIISGVKFRRKCEEYHRGNKIETNTQVNKENWIMWWMKCFSWVFHSQSRWLNSSYNSHEERNERRKIKIAQYANKSTINSIFRVDLSNLHLDILLKYCAFQFRKHNRTKITLFILFDCIHNMFDKTIIFFPLSNCFCYLKFVDITVFGSK